MEYSPFTSVAAPRLVPTTMTLAPTKGSPVSVSVTRPDIDPSCAMRNVDIPITRKKIVANLDLIGLFINPPFVNYFIRYEVRKQIT